MCIKRLEVLNRRVMRFTTESLLYPEMTGDDLMLIKSNRQTFNNGAMQVARVANRRSHGKPKHIMAHSELLDRSSPDPFQANHILPRQRLDESHISLGVDPLLVSLHVDCLGLLLLLLLHSVTHAAQPPSFGQCSLSFLEWHSDSMCTL